MATVTPNFNWPVPTSTDLVKDGATAIEALGDSIDASLVDLKGGTTGQVLSKTSGTDMDFTWVTTDDANAIQNSIVDAKGDLIAATANDTPARLAVGNNGETLVADSSTSTGLRYQSAYNGNAIINGGMDIWQRGTSFAAPTSNTYTADRFIWQSSSVASKTLSRQSSGLTGIQYSIRVARDSGNTNTASNYIGYSLETADSYRFAGQTVTFSFYAKAGANYSPTSSLLGVRWSTGTGTDQNYLSNGFTGNVNLFDGTQAITTTWTRYSFTATVGSTATQMGFFLSSTPTGTAGANDWFEVTGLQIEFGSVATQFKRSNGSGGTLQGELSACQRYYYRQTAGSAYSYFSSFSNAETTTTVYEIVTMPVTMRTPPATLDYANLGITDQITLYNGGTITLDSQKTTNICAVKYAHTSASLTQFRGYVLNASNNSAAYVGLSSEL